MAPGGNFPDVRSGYVFVSPIPFGRPNDFFEGAVERSSLRSASLLQSEGSGFAFLRPPLCSARWLSALLFHDQGAGLMECVMDGVHAVIDLFAGAERDIF